ncbi:MAG: HAD family hydrolase [Planctomycetota bacterium]
MALPSAIEQTHTTSERRLEPLKISLISLHGLIRGKDLELGHDADTGGQTKYVLELAHELAKHENVESVELLTRQIIDPSVSDDYAQLEEPIAENAKIVRIPFGPKRYLRKEALWPYIEFFVDQCLAHYRRVGVPSIIHGHYADAGLAGAELANLLHVPFLFTGHSLGRVKRQRLSLGKQSPQTLEKKYRFTQRIEAEETALETATMVITSTHQEIEQQYELYDHYQPDRMEVIPPGVDLSRFSPPSEEHDQPEIASDIERFLHDPTKPFILAVARPDERKNLTKLVEVYGRSPALRKVANLVLVMGTRDDFSELPRGQKSVIQNVLHSVDKYDLYGKVAYPKHHQPDDIPDLYRWAASKRGVFINPALTEPFGLTLLEAGATGLPIVATNDGGPRDIIGNCENGLLIDPLDGSEIERALLRMLVDDGQWDQCSAKGVEGTRKHYSWSNHVDRYIRDVRDIVGHTAVPALVSAPRVRRLPEFDRIIMADLDNTLTGDSEALEDFIDLINEHEHIGFAISTGRRLDSAMKLIDGLNLPKPDLIETDSGTQLHYGPDLRPDRTWRKQIGFAWNAQAVREAIGTMDGVKLQKEEFQSEFKVSFTLDEANRPSIRAIKKRLREMGVRAKPVVSLGHFLDIIPVRGGSEFSTRHVLYKWGFSAENLLVAGDCGNDIGMMLGRSLGVVVANHGPEMETLRSRPRVFFASQPHARGVLEGIEYYNFLGNIRIPNDLVEA